MQVQHGSEQGLSRAEGSSLLATSDLHVAHTGNRELVEGIRPYHPGDWLIVAGDVCDRIGDLESTLGLLRERFAEVIWTPGNHELWTPAKQPSAARGEQRYQQLIDLCRRLGVHTPEDDFLTWRASGRLGDTEDVVVAPLFTLYDYSWRSRPGPLADELAYAFDVGVVCTDEFLLDPDPHPDRQTWCRSRIDYSRARLAELGPDVRTVLVSHWPLHRQPTSILRWPHFAMWCGTELTERWHLEYRALAAVYGHLHIPITTMIDGVRFEEVSLGYPREWRKRPGAPPYPVRRILPADPDRRPTSYPPSSHPFGLPAGSQSSPPVGS